MGPFKTKHLKREEVKMAYNVSFKVYLKDPSQGEETEVRRFVVDKEVSTSLVYKCVVCDDYDLCAACEKAGKHPGHNMMRISSPEVIWPQRLSKRIRKMQEKAEQRSRCRQEKQEKKEEAAGNATGTGAPPPPPPFFGRGRGMFRGCGRGGMGGMGGEGR